MNIAELKASQPHLKDLSDAEVVDLYHQTYYPDVGRGDVAKALGVDLTAVVTPEKAPDRNMFGYVNDQMINAANAAVGTVKSGVDLVAPDSGVSEALGDFIQSGKDKQSDKQKFLDRKLQEKLRVADGGLDKAGEYLKHAVMDDPSGTVAQALGNIGPFGAIGRGAQAIGMGSGARTATMVGLAGASGAGEVRGNIWQRINQTPDADLMAQSPEYMELRAGGMPEAQAKEQIGANLSRNLPEVAAVGAISALGGKFGLEGMAGRVAPSMGRVAAAGVGALDEGMQGASEQVATNVGVRRAVPDQSLTEDVALNAVSEGLAGGVGGAAFGGQRAPDGPLTRAAKVAGPMLALPAPTVTVTPSGTAVTSDQRGELIRQRQEAGAGGIYDRTPIPEEPAAAPLVAQGPQEQIDQSLRNIEMWGKRAKAYPLEGAQARKQALADQGWNVEVVPHPRGEGFTVIPSEWMAAFMRNQVPQAEGAGLLPSPERAAPDAPLVDDRGELRPQTYGEQAGARAAQVDGQREADRKAALGLTPDVEAAQAARANPMVEPETLPQTIPQIPMDNSPTGTFIAGDDGVRAETKTDVLRRQDSARSQKEEADRKASMGLTPDVEKAQAARMASVALPGDLKAPSGRPFQSEHGAKKARQKSKGGDIVKVDGGWVVRLAAQDAEVINGKTGETAQPIAGDGGSGPSDNASSASGIRYGADVTAASEPSGTGLAAVSGKPGGSGGEIAPSVPGAESGRDGGPLNAVAGDKIDDEWTAFKPESGTLAIPRADMPQVKVEHRGAMTNFLNARGIEHESDEVPASSLKPTQAEFAPAKVAKAKEFTGGDRSILVSEDGHVADGHHQWLSKLDKDEPVKVIRLKAPIKDLLEQMKAFPSSEVSDGAAPGSEATADVQQQAQPVGATGEGAGGSRSQPAATDKGPRVIGRAGRTPNTARNIELHPNKNGTVTPHIEGYEMLDFESGDPVTLPADVSDADAIEAVKKSGSLGRGTKFYSAKKDNGDVVFSRRNNSGNQIPDAIIGRRLGDLNNHPQYEAAKSGDDVAGLRVAQDLVTDDLVEMVRKLAGDGAIFVPVLSVEATGHNKIPQGVAVVLANQLSGQTAKTIVQANSPKRTAMDGLDRVLTQPVFEGEVQKGGRYVLVDDTLTQGGTFAALASHIKDNGGEVVGAVALTGKQYSAKITPSVENLQTVRDRYADLEPQFQAATGYGFDALTESEARYLAKHGDADTVRTRISEEGQRALGQGDEGTAGEGEVTPFRRSTAARESDAVVQAIREQVKKLTSGWENSPEIVVLASFEDAPEAAKRTNQQLIEAGATTSPDAFMTGGKVYLLASRIQDQADVRRLVSHEVLGHQGLRGHFGDSLNDILDQMWSARRPEVKAKAEEYGLDINTEDGRRLAAEEVLAGWAESQPKLGFVRRAVAAIRAWLRKHFSGMQRLTLTDSEIIAQYLIPARGFIERGRAETAGDMALAFSRAKPDDVVFARSPAATDSFQKEDVESFWKTNQPSKLDDLLYTLQDKLIDTRRVVKAAKEQLGKLSASIDPYLQEELFHGRATQQTEEFLRTDVQPLLRQMAASNLTIAEVEQYLHARHAPERNAAIAKINPDMPDGGSGMKTADATAYMGSLKPQRRKALELVAAKVDAITAGTRKHLLDTGLESAETIASLDQAYKHYVPLQREDVESGGSSTGTGPGFSIKGTSIKRAMGSEKGVVDILANLVMQRERAITRAEKNRVSQALYGLSIKAPNRGFWIAIDPNSAKGDEASRNALMNDLRAMGLEAGDADAVSRAPLQRFVDPSTGIVSTRVNPALRSRDNVVSARFNGVDRFVVFNEGDARALRMAKALKNLDTPPMGTLMNWAAKFTRYFAAVNTQYNPVFGIINLMRDTQGALVNLSTTPLSGKQKEVASNVLPILREVFKLMRARRAGEAYKSELTAVVDDFEKAGGKTGWRDSYATSQDRAEALQKEIEMASNAKTPRLFVMRNLRTLGGLLTDYNDALENCTRIAAYKVAIEQGLSKEDAASLAKNLTVNFNRKGAIGSQAGALYAFFNASVQGSARLAETLSGPTGKKILKGGVLLGVAQAMLLAGAGFDDGEPPDFVVERAFVIPTGDGKYLSIPMPLGLHLLPNLGRITTQWGMSGFENTGKHIVSIMGLFADSFNPIGNAGMSVQTLTPTILDPLVALSENKDFAGRPIARKDFNPNEPTPGFTRAKDTATPIAKYVAEAVNWLTGGSTYRPGAISPTPDQIDYLIGEAGGGVAREVGKAWQTAKAPIDGDDLPSYKMPLIGRLIGDANEGASQASSFYENLKQLNEHQAEIEGRRKDGGNVEEYLTENPEAGLYKFADKVEKRVSNLRKLKRRLTQEGRPASEVQGVEKRLSAEMRRLNERIKAAKASLSAA